MKRFTKLSIALLVALGASLSTTPGASAAEPDSELEALSQYIEERVAKARAEGAASRDGEVAALEAEVAALKKRVAELEAEPGPSDPPPSEEPPPVEPEPEEPAGGFPMDANQVTIDGQARAIAGYDKARGEGELVVYTKGTTGTNRYGVEVKVGADSKVISVHDRLTTDSGATAVPAGGYVLSGHQPGQNWQQGPAEWLKQRAQVGDIVTLSKATTPPPPPVVPPTEPTTGPEPVPGTGMPAKVRAMWKFRYSPAPNMRAWPADVKQSINHVVLGLAQGNSGNGTMEYSPSNGQSVADHAADIREFRGRGVNVVMGFGGSGSNIRITNEAQVQQALAFFEKARATYGINGFDVDLESPDLWNEQSLNSLARQAKAKWGGKDGSEWVVGLTVGLYGDRTAKWLSAARLMGNNYDYMAPMLYDFPEAGNAAQFKAVWLDKHQVMRNGGVPSNKIIFGVMMRPNASYTNSTPNPQFAVDAWKAVVAKDPNVRGYFEWEDKIARDRNWDLTRAMANVVK